MRTVGQGLLDIVAACVLIVAAAVFIGIMSALTGAVAYIAYTSPAVQMVGSVIIVVGIGVYWWSKVF